MKSFFRKHEEVTTAVSDQHDCAELPEFQQLLALGPTVQVRAFLSTGDTITGAIMAASRTVIKLGEALVWTRQLVGVELPKVLLGGVPQPINFSAKTVQLSASPVPVSTMPLPESLPDFDTWLGERAPVEAFLCDKRKISGPLLGASKEHVRVGRHIISRDSLVVLARQRL